MATFPFVITPQTDDERFMYEALKEAWKAFQKDEVPVGAVLVHDGRVIARGYNQVEMLNDATAHAEMLCITAGEVALELQMEKHLGRITIPFRMGVRRDPYGKFPDLIEVILDTKV